MLIDEKVFFNLDDVYNNIEETTIQSDDESVVSNESYSSVDTTYDRLYSQHLYLFKVTPFIYTLYSVLIYIFFYYIGSTFY